MVDQVDYNTLSIYKPPLAQYTIGPTPSQLRTFLSIIFDASCHPAYAYSTRSFRHLSLLPSFPIFCSQAGGSEHLGDEND